MLKRAISAVAATGIALVTLAAPAVAGTNTGGSGSFAGPYNSGTYSWSTTVVSNKNWDIVNSTLTVYGGYNWMEVFTLTEKRAVGSGDPYTVTGSVTLTNPYGTGTEAIVPFTSVESDVPWSGDGAVVGNGPTVAQDTARAALFAAEYDLVYYGGIPGVNADYWI